MKINKIILALGASVVVLTGCGSEPDQERPASPSTFTTTSAESEYTDAEQDFLDYIEKYEGIKPYEGQMGGLVDSYNTLCDDTPPVDYDLWDVMDDNPWLKRDDAISIVTTAFSMCAENK